jgi:hypothetical protein
VSDLGLGSGEYITAIRLEYGQVEVGFTSKNYADYSMNDGSIYTGSGSGSGDGDEEESNGDMSAHAATASVQRAHASGTRAMDVTGRGGLVDWTPTIGSPFYATGAALAQGLKPAVYMVTAVRGTYEAEISSTVTARIAREDMIDSDEDGVVTNVIATFATGSDPARSNLTVETAQVSNPSAGATTVRGTAPPQTTPGGGSDDDDSSGSGSGGSNPDTGDRSGILPWFLLAVAALVMMFYLINASGYVPHAPGIYFAEPSRDRRSER